MGETARVLQKILHGEVACVFDYAERRDFDALWNALDDGCASLAGKTVVICWSRTVSDPSVAPVATAPHVTPIDWAACAASLCADLEVVVVDLDAGRHLDSPAVALFARLDQLRFPWLRIVRPSDLVVRSLDELCQWFTFRSRPAMDASPHQFLALRRAMLTAPHPTTDRHAITNLVGPLVLLRRRPEDIAGHAKALWYLLRCSGIEMQEAEGSCARVRSAARLRELRPVRIVLLDDQWHHGWAEWVGKRLELPWNAVRASEISQRSSTKPVCLLDNPDVGVSLWVSDSPDWLLNRLEEAFKKRDEQEKALKKLGMKSASPDARFRLRLIEEATDPGEVLLLDLRLFPPDVPAAKQFVSRAIPWVRRFLTDTHKTGSLPWPGFTPTEVTQLEQWSAWSGELRVIVYDCPSADAPIGSRQLCCGVGPIPDEEANLWREPVAVNNGLYAPIGTVSNSRFDAKIGEVISVQVSEVVADRSMNKLSLRWRNARALGKMTEKPTPLADILRYAAVNDTSGVLTLLPRLLALADMSLPIVIFSSTGRRDIVAKLGGYDSVVTRFSKPRFFGDAVNVSDEASQTFDEAMDDAVWLLRGRKRVAPYFDALQPTSPTGGSSLFGHAALFLDEAGQAHEHYFTVGGILALFHSKEAEQEFDTILQANDIHWGPGGLGKSIHTGSKKQQEIGTKVLELAHTHNVALRAIAIVVQNPLTGTSAFSRGGGHPWPERDLDYLHRTLVRIAAEAALFHIIRDEEMAGTWSFALLTDMRSRPQRGLDQNALHRFGLWLEALDREGRKWKAVDDLVGQLGDSGEADALLLAAALKDYWQAHAVEADDACARWKIPFLSGSGVFPILDDLLHQYEAVPQVRRIAVHEAQACHLSEGRPSARQWPSRSLHFLADWLVGEVRNSLQRRDALAGWVQALVDAGGCVEILESVTGHHLRFAREAMAGELTEALAGFISTPIGKPSALRTRCAAVIVDKLRAAPGSVFVGACRRADVRTPQVVQGQDQKRGGAAVPTRPLSTPTAGSRPVPERSDLSPAASGKVQTRGKKGATEGSAVIDASRSLYIGVGKQCDDDEIVRALSPAPSRIVLRRGHNSLWYAFAEFKTTEEAAEAKRNYRGSWKVSAARSQPQRLR